MDIKQLLNKEIKITRERLSIKRKYEFFNNLSILISTGVQIKDSIQIISEEANNDKSYKKLLNTLTADLVTGSALSESMKESKKFSDFEVFSVKLGEETGMLHQALDNLSNYSKNNMDLKRKIISSLSYPLIILATAVIAVIFMLNFVVPMFSGIFQRFGKELPAITLLIIKMSENIKYYILLLLAFIIVIYLVHRNFRTNEKYRSVTFSMLLKIPILGTFLRKINLAKFSSAMELFVNSGVPMVKAINLMKEIINFYPLQDALNRVEFAIINGNSFHQALSKEKFFDSRMVAMIKVGTEVNKLGLIFKKLKDNYNEDVMYQASVLNGLLEPILIILIGLLVSIILIAMYLPIFQLGSTYSM